MNTPNVPKIGRILLLIYLFCVLWLTLLDRTPTAQRMELTPLWEYYNLFRDSDPLFWFQQITCNILMLVPLGFLLPLLYESLRDPWKMTGIGCGFSVAIEIAQFVTARGLCEFDDVLNNTLGAFLGYWLYEKLSQRYSDWD
jgi:glycopeptide antibiotics resistance protein